MLQEQGVNIVFHGHKHQSGFFWDSREEASTDGRTHDRHDMLVLSGGTIGGGGASKQSLANVVEITPRPHGHDVKIWSLADYVEDSENRAKQAMFFDRRRLSPIDLSSGLIEELRSTRPTPDLNAKPRWLATEESMTSSCASWRVSP